MSREESRGDNTRSAHPPTFWGRLTLAVSLLIVLSVAGALIWHGITNARPADEDAAPRAEAEIRISATRSHRGIWHLPLRVRNTGNVALEMVRVRVTLTDGAGRMDEREVDFEYLAEGAMGEAIIVSENPPEQAKPKAEVLSYKVRRSARGY
jgi:uncharacterized protein (TIGR02588 family)